MDFGGKNYLPQKESYYIDLHSLNTPEEIAESRRKERRLIITSLAFPIIMTIVIWSIKLFEVVTGNQFVGLGIYPCHAEGLIGIIMAPLLHEDFGHLFSNTPPLLVLGFMIGYFHPSVSKRVFALTWILTGIMVWLFARNLNEGGGGIYHIGASGLVYGFVAFLFLSSVLRRDIRSLAVTLFITFMYGSLIWGVFPGQEGISWESHLFGSMVGIVLAIVFRKYDVPEAKHVSFDELGPEDKQYNYQFDPNKYQSDTPTLPSSDTRNDETASGNY